ncbi:MAG: RecQ family ATP-dependent DNA helicase [Termitinemataceae bacterium]|nr:MAG: RecQ family ATP-dependent DNA helicase [Termitinemataceae bacterium]
MCDQIDTELEGLCCKDHVQAALKKFFGLDYLFPYQRLVIGNILDAVRAGTAEEPCEDSGRGRQIVILPTGAGKSLCFQLPAMMIEGITLVIYPILSLMADQERRLNEKNFAPVILRGGQSADERNEIFRKIKSKESRFIIANPEVLLSEKMMESLGDLGIQHIVIDEAHCVSEWGLSFRPSYLEISKIIEASRAPVVTAFTATASEVVLEKIEKYIFGGEGAHKIIGNPDRSNIAYSAQGALLKDLAVVDLIRKNELPAIVFCSSRNGCEKLSRYLRNILHSCEIKFYHAGLSREEKAQVENWYFKSDNGVLVATCAYGMGVDKSNVRTVIHRDFPPSVEAYLQESGRAGRDGKFSRAFLLWGGDDDLSLQRAKTEYDKNRLLSLFEYARNTTDCRREKLLTLLNYAGEGTKPESECCDVCEKKSLSTMREENLIVDFFSKNKRCYTQAEAAVILEKNKTITWSGSDAKKAIGLMLKMNKLKQYKSIFWKNKLGA